MIRGVAGQPVRCNLRDVTTGLPYLGNATVWINQDAAPVAVQGTVGGGIVTTDARGVALYVPTALENAYANLAFTFDAPGAIGDTVQIATISPQEISALQTATGLSSVVINQLLLEAFIEIRYGRAMDTLEPGLLEWARGKLNRMLDLWNADPSADFHATFTSYTPVINTSPMTIGPNAANWAATARPDKITGANVVLNNVSPAVRVPIRIQDAQWWLEKSVQRVGSSIVTDLYYSPDWPNGEVNLWPIPTVAYPIELMTDALFANYAMTDVLWLPFGYREAITLSLAEALAPGAGQTVSADLKGAAALARVTVFGNNSETRNIRTRDGGMPGGRRRGGGYNYRTGRIG